MSFVVRAINLTIQLGTGSFGASGQNTVQLTGLRVVAQLSAVLNTSLQPGAANATIRVYGLTLSMMNQLTKAGLQWTDRQNLIAVTAGDSQSGMSVVFNGTILEAYPDFTGMPNVAFVISAVTGNGINLKPTAPVSYPGTADAATVMQSIAQTAGLQFENNGVAVQLASPYFAGTAGAQIAACAKAADCYAYIDGKTNTLAVWPKNGSRGGSVPIVSPQTGMIGYPAYQQNYIIVRSIFNPAIKDMSTIIVQSQLTPACGLWRIVYMDYLLSSQEVDGPWEMTMTCTPGNA